MRRTEFLARVDLPPGPTPEERIKAFIDAGQHGPAFKVENVAHQTRASACKAVLTMLPAFLLMFPGGAALPPPTPTDEQVLTPILAVIKKHKKNPDSDSAKKYNQCLAQAIGAALGFPGVVSAPLVAEVKKLPLADALERLGKLGAALDTWALTAELTLFADENAFDLGDDDDDGATAAGGAKTTVDIKTVKYAQSIMKLVRAAHLSMGVVDSVPPHASCSAS